MTMGRWIHLALVIGAGLGTHGCGSNCTSEACAPGVTITANVPDIGSATWTVTACLNGNCVSTELTSTTPATSFGLGYVTLEPGDAAGSLLTVKGRIQQPHDGDQWSVDVVDDQGNSIVHWARAVTYQTYEHSCSSCLVAFYSAN